MRRTLIILAALVLLAAIGFSLYYLFFRSAPGLGTVDPGGSFGGTGGEDAGPGPALPDIGVPVTGAGDEVAPRLFRITEGPVAEGAIVLTIEIPGEPIGTSTVSAPTKDIQVRYVDRATGNLYRYLLGERTLERLTNRTLPGIQEAVWARDGSRAFLRFLADDGAGERIETYSLPADGSEGYLLEPGLSDVVVGSTTVLAILPSTNGAIGTRATLAGTNPATAFSTALSSFRYRGAGAGYTATTRASASLLGFSFYVAPDGSFTRLFGPLAALAVLPSPSGGRYLASSLTNGTLHLDLLTISPVETTTLPLSTLAEKCIWTLDETEIYCAVPRALSGTLPDDWYQGEVSLSDRIWKIDLSSRVASLVFDPLLVADADIDAIALTLDNSADTLVFTNKKDGSLWLYDL
jgi:hypothetical protein